MAEFKWPDGRRAAVTLTFDDGRPSQLEQGLPILDRYGVKATFYVSLGNIDARLDDWRRVAAAGHEIGNHTFSHPCTGNFRWSRRPALESMTLDDMAADIDRAQHEIEARLGVRPRTFAYPCGQTFVGRGRHRRSYVPLVAERFVVGRGFLNEVENDPTFFDAAMAMGCDADGLSWPQHKAMIHAAAETGGWLILAGHDIGANGHQSITTDALDALCAFCTDPANGIWIDTAATIGEYVRLQCPHLWESDDVPRR